MPEMEPHETFDGKPSTFEVGSDYPYKFKERSYSLSLFSLDLYDQIETEAGTYGWIAQDFLVKSFSVGNLFVRMDPRDKLGFKTDQGVNIEDELHFLDPNFYPQGLNFARVSISHSIQVSSDSGNILMEQCNKFGLGKRIDEAFERNIYASLKISKIQRTTGASLYLERNGRLIKTHLLPQVKVQDQEQS